MTTQTIINHEAVKALTLALENPDGKSTKEGRQAFMEIAYKHRQPTLPNECFFAFGTDQFREAIRSRRLQEAYDHNRIRSAGNGLYGTDEGLDRYFSDWRQVEVEQREAMCAAGVTPQDVYLAEYDNYECMYDWDGDLQALRRVAYWFGVDAVRRIRRKDYTGADIETIITKL